MTVGDFRNRTKDLSDDCNLIMSIYSDNGDDKIINDVDVMGINVKDNTVYILN